MFGIDFYMFTNKPCIHVFLDCKTFRQPQNYKAVINTIYLAAARLKYPKQFALNQNTAVSKIKETAFVTVVFDSTSRRVVLSSKDMPELLNISIDYEASPQNAHKVLHEALTNLVQAMLGGGPNASIAPTAIQGIMIVKNDGSVWR